MDLSEPVPSLRPTQRAPPAAYAVKTPEAPCRTCATSPPAGCSPWSSAARWRSASAQRRSRSPLADAIHDALAAPQPAGVTARIDFTNHPVDAASLQGADPLLTGAKGRLWA